MILLTVSHKCPFLPFLSLSHLEATYFFTKCQLSFTCILLVCIKLICIKVDFIFIKYFNSLFFILFKIKCGLRLNLYGEIRLFYFVSFKLPNVLLLPPSHSRWHIWEMAWYFMMCCVLDGERK